MNNNGRMKLNAKQRLQALILMADELQSQQLTDVLIEAALSGKCPSASQLDRRTINAIEINLIHTSDLTVK